jgi:hypothetical protein
MSTRPVREARIEDYLRARVRDAGGICVKLGAASYVGIPDRLVVLPGGWIVFVEVKKPKGGRIGRLQMYWRRKLLELGCRHRFVLTREAVDGLMEDWKVE